MNIVRVFGVVLCLTGLSVAPAFAQKDTTAGVDLGFNMSRISPDASGQTITRGPGLLAGGWVAFQPWVPVGIQIELLYSQKHSHLSSTTDLSLDYLEIPVLAKLKLFKTIYMLEGVAFDFPVSAKTTTSGTDKDIKSQVNNPDIGMIIAGGVPVSKQVALEFRYEGGFKQVDTSANAAVQRNRSLSGVVRVQFK
jgi:hypothetical protein